MEKPSLPPPKFKKDTPVAPKPQPHYLTPSGMTLLPREKQPPPMYGKRGTTLPSKFLQRKNYNPTDEQPKHFFCETCEFDLQSVDDLRRHKSQHEKCPVDGCKYKAHPSVMDKHVTELHISGIYDKVKKLSTPEEIAAWRDERRKKYPTLENAKKLQMAKEQRQKRGERLEVNKARFGRLEDRKRARRDNKSDTMQQNETRHAKRSKMGNSQHEKNKKQYNIPNVGASKRESKEAQNFVAKIAKEEMHIEVCGLQMFKGTRKMKDYKHDKPKQENKKNVLTGLVGMYGSDDEDDEDDDGNDEESDKSVTEEDSNAIDTIIETVENSSLGSSNTISKDELKEIVTVQVNPIEVKTLNVENIVIRPAEEQPVCNENESETKSCVADLEPNTNDCPMADVKEQRTIDENDSSLNSTDEGPEEAPIERRTKETETNETNPCSSTNVTNSVSSVTTEAVRRKQDKARILLQEKRRSYLNFRKAKLRRQNTMLRKLLEPEIRHERNVLLQCVRFVCENNFFGIGSEESEDKSKPPS